MRDEEKTTLELLEECLDMADNILEEFHRKARERAREKSCRRK